MTFNLEFLNVTAIDQVTHVIDLTSIVTIVTID